MMGRFLDGLCNLRGVSDQAVQILLGQCSCPVVQEAVFDWRRGICCFVLNEMVTRSMLPR